MMRALFALVTGLLPSSEAFRPARDTMMASLTRLGITEVIAVYEEVRTRQGLNYDFLMATDLGIVDVHIREELLEHTTDQHGVGPAGHVLFTVDATVCAWADVRDIEISTTATTMSIGGPAIETRLKIQVPRFDALESPGRDLGDFGAALIREHQKRA